MAQKVNHFHAGYWTNCIFLQFTFNPIIERWTGPAIRLVKPAYCFARVVRCLHRPVSYQLGPGLMLCCVTPLPPSAPWLFSEHGRIMTRFGLHR